MDDHTGMGFFVGVKMGERFKKMKQGQDQIQDCDYCYKTDVDFIRETGTLGKWWEDIKYQLRACDDCKKHEGKRESLCVQEI